ncbi:MAG: DNA polymerase III subunit epsilon [Coriobacteriaceae bacterium]|nr:DNA polymerase III subunit epsilon [Coriobacteriaceae bacterium]
MTDSSLDRHLAGGTAPDTARAYALLAERARDAVFGFEEEVAFVDIETTGFDPVRDRVIEVGALIARGPEILGRYSSTAAPGVPVPPEIVRLTGITDEELADAPRIELVVQQLREFVGVRDIVAHNAPFDRAFLEHAGGGPFPGRWLDSLELARIALPRLATHRLWDLSEAFGLTQGGRGHRAPDDAAALAGLWRVLLCGLDALPDGVLARLAGVAPEAAWPLRETLAHIAAGRAKAPFDLKESRTRAVRGARTPAMLDAEEIECAYPAEAEVAAEFSAGGLLGRIYPGFEPRDEQARMAEAVARAFETRTHLAVEAATGVGKSVAYLVPAALLAMGNRIGVGVATRTNALSDQLVHSELPALSAALGGELRFAALKGYERYLCLRKLERSVAEVHDAEAAALVAALVAWVAQSPHGDLDQVNVHWRPDVRSRVTATVADCTKKRCRFYPELCYVHGARRRAACAHIVVTNQALLFRDMVAGGEILPPLRHWVVDEAHAAESEARRQLSLEAAHVELAAVLGALYSKRHGGLLANLRRKLVGALPDEAGPVLRVLGEMERAAEKAATLTASLFDFVKDLAAEMPESGYEVVEARVSPSMRASGGWGTVAGVGRSLARTLETLLDEGRRLVTASESLGETLSEQRADLVGLLTRLADQHAGLLAVLDGEDVSYVYSVTLDRRRDVTSERLSAQLLDVGEALAEGLYPRVHSVVYTSATIAAGEDFSHFARSVGLDLLSEGAWSGLRLDSSYDFDRQMTVFVATDVEPPDGAGYLAGLEGLLESVHLGMGGSVLTLFTNRRDMEELHRRLAERLGREGVPLLVQGRGTSAKRLRDEFIADERVSLFATKSFWEGFDAKGDTLRCVVVPRLPFGRPSDPLAAERDSREGKAAWARYALPEAILELKQAAGRLVRSSTDTGCVVIADSRVVSKGYGRSFLDALPVRDVERLPAARIAEEIARRFGRVREGV